MAADIFFKNEPQPKDASFTSKKINKSRVITGRRGQLQFAGRRCREDLLRRPGNFAQFRYGARLGSRRRMVKRAAADRRGDGLVLQARRRRSSHDDNRRLQQNGKENLLEKPNRYTAARGTRRRPFGAKHSLDRDGDD